MGWVGVKDRAETDMGQDGFCGQEIALSAESENKWKQLGELAMSAGKVGPLDQTGYEAYWLDG